MTYLRPPPPTRSGAYLRKHCTAVSTSLSLQSTLLWTLAVKNKKDKIKHIIRLDRNMTLAVERDVKQQINH